MELNAVAQRWAHRIRVEFAGYEDLMSIADELTYGNPEVVYRDNRHLIKKSITNVPGKPIKLYFLKELVLDLRRFYEDSHCGN